MLMLKRYSFFLLAISVLVLPLPLFAVQSTSGLLLKSEIESQETYPGKPYYQMKRLKEKVSELLIFFPDSKLNYSRKLLRTRFSELNHIIQEQSLDEVQRSSERFAYQAGKLTELAEKEPKEAKEKTINLFKTYQDDLNQMKYKFEQDSGFWILVLHDINTLDYLTARLKKD